MKLRVMVMAAATLLLVAGCSSSTSSPTSVELSKAPNVLFHEVGIDQVRDSIPAVVAATTRLGPALAADSAASNALVAPWSTATLLAMLRSGASGETKTRLDAFLGGASDDTISALLGQVQQIDGDPGAADVEIPSQTPAYHQGVGLFIRKSVPVEREFVRGLAAVFGTGYYPVDFSGNDPLAGISEWLSVNTGSDSARAPSAMASPSSVMTGMSSAFLSAAWATPFPEQSTATGIFTTGSGRAVTVPFLSGTVPGQTARGAGWNAVRLPFGPGLAMNIVLPDASGPATTITAQMLLDADAALRTAPVTPTPIELPRWVFHGSTDLTRYIGPATAFSGIGRDVRLSAAVTQSSITIGERGTAPAPAGSAPLPTLPPPPPNAFVADHPFAYEIVDTATGLPLYYGRVANPVIETSTGS